MTLEAGASTNSIFVDSTGRVGFRTSTPVLDLHVNTSNTPAMRLEQNNSGGFTAQTWDIAGNEANFFVRDVTGGSTLSFRIRPGAPTSSIDIAANGNVGIGTASPPRKLRRAVDTARRGASRRSAADSTADPAGRRHRDASIGATGGARGSFGTLGNAVVHEAATLARLSRQRRQRRHRRATGRALHTTGGVRLRRRHRAAAAASRATAAATCRASSRRAQFKNITGDLPPDVALANVMALRPQTGSYKETPDVPEHWLIAEEVGAVDPALIGLDDGKPYVVKTQNVVADLVAVVQQQQREIDELKRLSEAQVDVPSAAASA